MISCVGAKALGLARSCSVAERKKVIWKPIGLPSGVLSQPVTYHHSVRKSGCAPLSCGSVSGCPGVTCAKRGGAANCGGAHNSSRAHSSQRRNPDNITSPPVQNAAHRRRRPANLPARLSRRLRTAAATPPAPGPAMACAVPWSSETIAG